MTSYILVFVQILFMASWVWLIRCKTAIQSNIYFALSLLIGSVMTTLRADYLCPYTIVNSYLSVFTVIEIIYLVLKEYLKNH